ncbi:hypothetical protein TNCV_938251 [Trichonephila clavipes]|nr:hypothetical protein TNCV_938251 [Trichonephila clavipes]
MRQQQLSQITVRGHPEQVQMCLVACNVPLRHKGILNSRRSTSLLVRLVEGEEKWEIPDNPQGDLPQNWGGTEQICIAPTWCSKLRITTGV